MTHATVIFFLIALSTGIFGLFCIMRRPGWLAIILFASTLLICYFSTIELMGRPKPVQYEVTKYQIQTVIAWRMVFKERIFLWVAVDGVDEPIAYVLPWDDKMAESLEASFRKAGIADRVIANEAQINRLNDGRDENVVFYAEPQRSEETKPYTE
jgi:hypothetical protein